MAHQAIESFTSAVAGTKYVFGRRMVVAVGAIGAAAWVGTIKVRWSDKSGVERYCTDSAGVDLALTTNGWAVALDFGQQVKARLECTSYGSGTIAATLQAEDYVRG
jgi:hypothetical protein